MAKYINNITIVRTDEGKRYYTSAIPSGDVSKPSIEYKHKARMGDRWDTIAYKYLGDAKYWYVIARANGGANGSIFIKPGTTIVIPEVI
jgi:nucleoid-associated protein YgaU